MEMLLASGADVSLMEDESPTLGSASNVCIQLNNFVFPVVIFIDFTYNKSVINKHKIQIKM